MSGKLTVLVGLPGSGKTTLARKLVDEDAEHKTLRINRDDLRMMAFGAYWFEDAREMEPLISMLEERAVTGLLRKGVRVVIDATNLSNYVRDRWIRKAAEAEAEYEEIFLDVDVDTCVERDAARFEADGVRLVGREVIERMNTSLKRAQREKSQ